VKTSSHSEYFKLQRVYIKPSLNAFVSQSHLNEQWSDLNYLDVPDFEASIKEYESFEKCLTDFNTDILYFSKDDSVTIDSIYCRDASIATDFGMILCNMGKVGRKNEPSSHKQVYVSYNIPILGEIKASGTLEGGDVAWLDEKTLAVGHSYRTNLEGIAQLKTFLEPNGIEVVVAELPHYKGQQDVFHLMSILSPVDKDLALIYSPLMPIKFRNELLDRGFELIEVPDEEFESLGCNVLAIAPRHCIMVEGNPITQKRLETAGCIVTVYKGEEISVKGGGGPTCLTRPMLRSY
jgi:N-dimethylarginine dimethylaminohydrolase